MIIARFTRNWKFHSPINLFVLLAGLFFVIPSAGIGAEEIFLRNGQVILGTIRSQTRENIKVYTLEGQSKTISKRRIRKISYTPVSVLRARIAAEEKRKEEERRKQEALRAEKERIRLAAIRKKEEEERKKEEQRLAEQKRMEEERLAEQKRKEEEETASSDTTDPEKNKTGSEDPTSGTPGDPLDQTPAVERKRILLALEERKQHNKLMKERIRLQMTRGDLRLDSGDRIHAVVMIKKGPIFQVQADDGFTELHQSQIVSMRVTTDEGTKKIKPDEIRGVREFDFQENEIRLASLELSGKIVGVQGNSVLIESDRMTLKVPREEVLNSSVLPKKDEKNGIHVKPGQRGMYLLKGDNLVRGELVLQTKHRVIIATGGGQMTLKPADILYAYPESEGKNDE